MKNTTTTVALIICFLGCFGVQPNDSGKTATGNTSQTPHGRAIGLFNDIKFYFSQSNIKSADLAVIKLADHLESLGVLNPQGVLSVLGSFRCFYVDQDVDCSIKLGIKALSELDRIKNQTESISIIRVHALNWLGIMFNNYGNCGQALKYYKLGVNLAEKINFDYGKSVAYNGMALLYGKFFKDTKLAEKYLRSSLEVAESVKDSFGIRTLHSNMGYNFLKAENLDSAQLYFTSAIELSELLRDSTGTAFNLVGSASVSLEREWLNRAQEEIAKAEMMNTNPVSWDYRIPFVMAQIARKRGQDDLADSYFRKALEKAAIMPDQEPYQEILLEMAEFSVEQGKMDQAVLYYPEAIKVAKDIEKKWSTGEVVKLELQASVSGIERQTERMEHERNLANAKLIFQRRVIYLLVLLSVLALGFGSWIFYQNRRMKHLHQLLVQKNRVLAQQRMSIVKPKVKAHSGPKMTEGMKSDIQSRISYAMEVEKAFLNPDINLARLAKMINTNTSYLSKVINTSGDKNFSMLINEYRVKEMLVHLEKEYNNGVTIIDMAMKFGFRSKSTFNKAFKLYTGVTPSYYLQHRGHSEVAESI